MTTPERDEIRETIDRYIYEVRTAELCNDWQVDKRGLQVALRELLAAREKAARIAALTELTETMCEPEGGGHPVWRMIEKERAK